ncbi:hypothetical protein [Myroides profundi]|uniref:Uncharacterized protein n=1 Tax=Myroides profundi TaxID=480520 RepID=A0AAJ5BFA3_MYRPR|nr:hypothetical protein [Myroides profundi]AJH15581.1 hypothetical protein MPR_2410 [Myroides profundi]SER52623.1 hypothetical protein SAMN04488089_11818 [Myroides profundi]
MIKKSIVLLLLMSFSVVLAQKDPCQIAVDKEFISKVKDHSSKDLIPYYSPKEKKWGYMNRVSQKKLTKPFMSNLEFFNPNFNTFHMHFSKQSISCKGEIKGSNNNYDTSEFGGISFFEPEVGLYVKSEDTLLVDEHVKGFKVDDKGELIGINPKYFDSQSKQTSLITIFSYHNQFYAVEKQLVGENQYYFTIINQNGESIDGFTQLTKYPEWLPMYSSQNDLWIETSKGDGKYQIRGLLSGKIMSQSSMKIIDQVNELAYGIVSLDGSKGVFDFLTMEWVIIPSKDNNFVNLYFSSLEEIDKIEKTEIVSVDQVKQNRDKVYIYILNEKNTFYDLDMKEYKPKK